MEEEVDYELDPFVTEALATLKDKSLSVKEHREASQYLIKKVLRTQQTLDYQGILDKIVSRGLFGLE